MEDFRNFQPVRLAKSQHLRYNEGAITEYPGWYATARRNMEEENMRGVHSAVDDIRRGVFTEVARLAYEYNENDQDKVDLIPYKLVPGDVAKYRHDVYLERAVIIARVRLALGMNIDIGGHLSTHINEAVTDQKYFEAPLVNVIH